MRSLRQKAASPLWQDPAHLVLGKMQRPDSQRDQDNLPNSHHQITRKRHRVTRMRSQTIYPLWMHQDLNMYLRLQVMITCYDKMKRRVGLTSEKFDL